MAKAPNTAAQRVRKKVRKNVADGVVHVRDAVRHVLANLLADALGSGIRCFCHDFPRFPSAELSSSLLQRLSTLFRTLAGASVGARTLAANRQAAAMTHAT